MKTHSTYASASAPAPGGGTARLVRAAFLTGALALGTACSALGGYDGITFETGPGETTTGDHRPLDPQCYPPKATGPVRSDCGVFVSAATGKDDSGDGSPGRPFRTLERALGGGKTIYACNDMPFNEALAISAAVTIFGGVDCKHDWTYSPDQRSVWHAPPGAVPLSVHSQATLLLCDFALVAASAGVPGGSSIGIIASPGAKLELQRCSVDAGEGMDAPPAEAAAGAGLDGLSGSKGNAGCMGADSSTPPGMGGELACDTLDVSGGPGGSGLDALSGADGTDGSPGAGNGNDGTGGKKQDASPCTSGSAGMKGEPGAPGNGDKALGVLGQEGYSGKGGDDGGSGKPGHGGGGGGGGKMCWSAQAGPSGGGGGSGGCGGPGGKGGRAGGASIGIVSLDASLVLTDVLITAGKGGKGSDGAQGGPGGKGGLGGAQGVGDSFAKACSGGKGGDGGRGGRGGGGRGGHSLGIAYRGAVPPSQGVEIKVDAPGDGGKGDSPDSDGAQGVAEKTQLFE